MSAHVVLSPVRAERSAMKKWAGMIVGLLLLQVVFGGVTVALALRGKGMVEDDYYNKALHWDDHEALVRASAQLGWQADIRVGSAATSQGQRALILQLTDKAGAPVENAQVQVAFFHYAHPLDIQQATLKATAAGMYVGSVPLNRAGKWEFRLTVHRPVVKAQSGSGSAAAPTEETFIATLQRDLLE